MKITISQEGSSPISIDIPERSNEAWMYLPVKDIREFMKSEKFISKVNEVGDSLKNKGVTILNKETIKPLKRSFATVLGEIFNQSYKLKETDFYNSVKWHEIGNYTISSVTHVTESVMSSTTYVDFFIWYTNNNTTCKAKRICAKSQIGTHWL